MAFKERLPPQKKPAFLWGKSGRVGSGGSKSVLAQAADGAHPILGDILPFGAGGDAAVGIADFGIVDVTAGAFKFFHGGFLLAQMKKSSG